MFIWISSMKELERRSRTVKEDCLPCRWRMMILQTTSCPQTYPLITIRKTAHLSALSRVQHQRCPIIREMSARRVRCTECVKNGQSCNKTIDKQGKSRACEYCQTSHKACSKAAFAFDAPCARCGPLLTASESHRVQP